MPTSSRPPPGDYERSLISPKLQSHYLKHVDSPKPKVGMYVFMKGGLLILAVLWCCGASAQLLTGAPYFPKDTSTLTITVNCNFGNQGLLNYGDTGVYVHIGLITDSSTSNTNWRYAPFTWGTANPAAAATYIGNNQYQFTFHNIRAYFGVPAAEIIYKVAILFRNATGSLAQRNTDGTDMFWSVYTTSLAGAFTEPPYQPMYTPIPDPINIVQGNTLPVKYLTNKTASLQLSYNGTQVASVASGDSVQTTLSVASTGNQTVIATANDGTTSIADTLSFFVSGATTFAPIPAGMNEGINYLPGDTSALLVVYAPLKHKVMVLGDFNNWTQNTAYQMNETPDSNYYWI
jgi:hypothetical protein